MSELTPELADCSWPIDTACLGEAWTVLDETVQERSVGLASATLRRLTGYRVGGCPVKVRPCKAGCSKGLLPMYPGFHGGNYLPHINAQGFWVNSCGCLTDCNCTELCSVDLPGPVGAVEEVRLNGDVVPAEDYTVLDTRLVWVGGGECPWPTCQDMSLPDTEDGTFSITYLNAYPVDALGAYAAAQLAMEFAKACTGGKCRLPTGVTNVTRQGVTYEIASAAFKDGYTGIREIDAFIAIWNPNTLQRSSRVWSPDMRSVQVDSR